MHQDQETDPESVGRQFGDMMRTHREERGLSQRQLAEHLQAVGLHLDPSAITRIERGTREVKLTEALLISQYLEFPLDYIASTPESQFRISAYNLKMFAVQARKTLLQAIRYIDRWSNNLDDETEALVMQQRGYENLVELYTKELRTDSNFRYGGSFGRIPEMSEGDNYAVYLNDIDHAVKREVVNAVIAHILVSEEEFLEFIEQPPHKREPPNTPTGGSDANA